MRRTILPSSADGLAERLHDMERQIADLQAVRGTPPTDVEQLAFARRVFTSEEYVDGGGVTLSWSASGGAVGSGIALDGSNSQRIDVSVSGIYLITHQTSLFVADPQTDGAMYALTSQTLNIWTPAADPDVDAPDGPMSTAGWQDGTQVFAPPDDPVLVSGEVTYEHLPTGVTTVPLDAGSVIEVTIDCYYLADVWGRTYLEITRIG